MDSLTINKIGGMLRVVLPMGITWLVTTYGLPADLTGPITEGLTLLITAGIGIFMSWRSNRADMVAKQAAAAPGVKIVVEPTADKKLQELAADPKIVNVQTP